MIATFVIILILLAVGLVGSIITLIKDGDKAGPPWFFGMLFGAGFVASCILAGELSHHQCQLEVQEYTVDQQVTIVNGDTTCVKYIINYEK